MQIKNNRFFFSLNKVVFSTEGCGSVQFISVAQSCPTLCDPMDCSTPGFPVLHHLEHGQTCVHQVSDAIQPSHPLWSSSPPAFNLSQHQGLFRWVRSSYQVTKVLELHFQNQSFQLIFRTDSFRIDWFDVLAVLESPKTLKSLLEHHSSKASVLWHSAFFIVQLSHLYITAGKAIALTIWTFLDKTMSLSFNMLSRLIIAFLPRSKYLLILWLQLTFAVILEPKKIVCYCFPIYLPWSDGTECHDLHFWMLRFKPAFSFSSFTFIKRLFISS